jgi:pimeloyl-ACP methyl ester carboxylesterase
MRSIGSEGTPHNYGMSDLFVEDIGSGDKVLLVHGGDPPAETWSDQRVFAARYRLLIPDGRGHDVDARAVAELLGDGAHLVGFDSGGVGSLLAAALRPEGVRSLTVIEPTAFGVAPDDPAVLRFVARRRAEAPEARIPLAELAAAPFATLVVSGAWSKAFETVCGVLTTELGAERAIFSGHKGHDVQHAAGFNERLETLWLSATKSQGDVGR